MNKVRRTRVRRSLRLAMLVWMCTLITPLLGCDRIGSRATVVIPPPTVTITSPASGHTIQAGVDVPINSTANDAQGILKVQLWVDGALYREDTSPDQDGQTTFVASQPWHAAEPGSHTMVVKAYSQSGQVAESLPVVINVLVSSVSVPTDTPTAVASIPTDTPAAADDTPVPPSSTPTDTPTLPPSQPTGTPSPTSDTPPPLPTDTPTPTDTPALPTVPEPFADVWVAMGEASGRLGDPVAEAVLERWVADQFFKGGLAYWRNNEFVPANYVYVLLYEDGTDETQGTIWLQFEDVWREGMPEFSCSDAEANGTLGPRRGFGKVWCEEAAVRDGLGLPLGIEQGANAGFQDFENGTMLWIARLGHIYVLYNDGDWERFDIGAAGS